MATRPLRPKLLRRRCSLKLLPFSSTAKLEEPPGILGQERALEALAVGTGIPRDGFNLFVLGPPGLGRHTVTRRFLERVAGERPAPDAWCYVHNFEEQKRPKVLRLPAARAKAFADAMAQLVTELRGAIAAAFESDEYRGRREAIEQEVKEHQEQGVEVVQHKAREKDITLIQTQSGIGFAPTKEGEILDPEAFAKLPAEDKQRIEQDVSALQEELTEVFRDLPRRVREGHRRVRELNEEVVAYAVEEPIEELRRQYKGLERVSAYLDAAKKDVVANATAFVPQAAVGEGEAEPSAEGQGAAARGLERYRVNLLGQLEPATAAPVVYEDHPTYHNLIGQVEHLSRDSALVTDFTLIKPGALHRANGGFLLLDARRLLVQPQAYEGLKQALRGRQIRIQSLGQQLSLISTVTLEPEPIPLDVKVVLIGERALYYQLCQLDPEFADLFKIAADFEETIDWTDEAVPRYAQLLGSLARGDGLRPLTKHATARVIEHGSRVCSDAGKLSIRIEGIADLLREANYWAARRGSTRIDPEAIEQAIDAQRERDGRVRELMQEQVLRETVLIETRGERIGQVNGLSVLQLGTHAFGRPCRISCSVRLGRGELLDIEREVQLGGPLHSKGVLILGGFLGARFGQQAPLAVSARLVFEQSYGGIDGDSASSAELYALLSALAELPLAQGLAVTGSVNQHGEVQAIGGVNEKIEGFFELCAARGLDGTQGVLVPTANVKHLMLAPEVIEAVQEKLFAVYAVDHIDQGIELLTGMRAGRRRADGSYSAGSVNGKVAERLRQFAEHSRSASGGSGEPPKPPVVVAAAARSHVSRRRR
jgi:predicted ATP-dependent protease